MPNCNTGSCPTPYWCKAPPANFPSVCQVTSQTGCTNSSWAPNQGLTQSNCWGLNNSGYGIQAPPPCGLNFNTNQCGSCCWDTTLCYPVPEECNPGDNVVSVAKPQQVPTLSGDAASLLAIYNYSLQRVVSRSLKFVTSYYDWLYCQNQFLVNGTTDTANQTAQNNPFSQGAGFLPPASLFTQLAQVLGWTNYTFNQLDLAQCFCSNLCQVLQMLSNLEGNSTIRNFILDNAFNNGGAVGPTQLGCGNLYDEGQLVDFGDKVVSYVDLISEVLKTLDLENDSERAEAFLTKMCACLQSATADGNQRTALGVRSDGTCNSGALPCCPGVKGPLAQQFFSMFMDLLQFLFFDRDCEGFDDKECGDCCPSPPNVEDWMQARCKAGTGNGKCVVCSGACAKYRKKDDYKPMLSVLHAVKYAVKFYTLDRSGGSDYATEVENTYNALLSDYYNLYQDADGDLLTFYPDCAAPQFCCSTVLAGGKCVNRCGVCTYTPGCVLCPVPCMDTRLATTCCGYGNEYVPCCTTSNGVPYTGWAPSTVYVNNVAQNLCATGGVYTTTSGDATGTSITAFCSQGLNPCVVAPKVCQTVSCSTACCYNDSTDPYGYQCAPFSY